MSLPPADSVRADKWLWAARLFKSRTLARAALSGGKVEVNDQSAKPARPLRPGDLIRVTLPDGKRIVRVLELAERRGPPAVARRLYADLTPPSPPRRSPPSPAYRPPGAGRPTKRERRQLERLRRPIG